MSEPSPIEGSELVHQPTRPNGSKRPVKVRLHHTLRWLHTYTSLFSLFVVLFFALTGITLNHPEWTFGLSERTSKFEGVLPKEALRGGEVKWLPVVEELRAKHALRGIAKDMRVDAGEGSLAFKGPGYSADCFFDVETGKYELTTSDQGFVSLMNDLHRGRDSGRLWNFWIDLSGALLSFVSLTGLGILFYLKKSRVLGFALGIAGTVLVVLLFLAAAR